MGAPATRAGVEGWGAWDEASLGEVVATGATGAMGLVVVVGTTGGGLTTEEGAIEEGTTGGGTTVEGLVGSGLLGFEWVLVGLGLGL